MEIVKISSKGAFIKSNSIGSKISSHCPVYNERCGRCAWGIPRLCEKVYDVNK